MSNNELVSVVIPCFNDKDYIVETLNSVINQTYKNIEIIIVDDGSDEKTKQCLRMLSSEKVQIISQGNKGLSAARNTGFRVAKGEYVLTIDSDDTVESKFLEKATLLLNKNDILGAVSSHVSVFRNPNRIISIHKPRGGELHDFLFENNSVSFALIRKKVWEEVGGYDEKMRTGFEDWDFWIAITKKGWTIGMIEELLFNYRRKDVSMLKNTIENQREENMNYIYKKHQDVYENYFSEVVDSLTNLAQRHKKNEVKFKKSLEFKIGKMILYPLRRIKFFFK